MKTSGSLFKKSMLSSLRRPGTASLMHLAHICASQYLRTPGIPCSGDALLHQKAEYVPQVPVSAFATDS